MKKIILSTIALISITALTAYSSELKTNSTPQTQLLSKKTSTKKSKKKKQREELKISQEVFDEAVEQVQETLKYETLYKDSQFILKEDSIVFVVQVNASTTKEKAKDIADTATRQLSSWLSYSYDELKSPGTNDFGNLPEYYSIKLGVGSDEKNMMIKKTINSRNNNGKI